VDGSLADKVKWAVSFVQKALHTNLQKRTQKNIKKLKTSFYIDFPVKLMHFL